jgi:predicted ribosome quality control (RQC) complex YloA/Tae2 family protein
MLSPPEKPDLFEEKKNQIRKILHAKLKKAKKRRELHLQDEQEGLKWEEEAHVAQLLQSYFYLLEKKMVQIVLEDWEMEGRKRVIDLNPLLEPAEQLKQRFRFSRKLKRKLEYARGFLKTFQQEIETLTILLQRLEAISCLDELFPFANELKIDLKSQARSTSHAPRISRQHPFREFVTQKGLKIFVGRKDKDNEDLTFSFAKGSDFWLHVANFPGSHVVLRAAKGEVPDEESLLDAMQLALHFSKAKKLAEEDVIVTQCKYLSKSKGSRPGLVNVSRHKQVPFRNDPKRLQRLLSTAHEIKK